MAQRFGHLSVDFKDANGVVAAQPYFFSYDDAQTLAAIATQADALITLLDAMINVEITRQSLKIQLPLPTLNNTLPSVGSTVVRQGLLDYSQLASNYVYGFPIPGMSPVLFPNGRFDITANAVSNLTTYLTTIVNAGTPLSKEGRDLVALVQGQKVFRKHRKAESRKSLNQLNPIA